MKTNYSLTGSFVALDANDLMQINGGTAQEAYNAGYALGQYARKILDSWQFIKVLFA